MTNLYQYIIDNNIEKAIELINTEVSLYDEKDVTFIDIKNTNITAKCSPLFLAVRLGRYQIAEKILEISFNNPATKEYNKFINSKEYIDCKDSKYSLIHYAAINDDTKMMELLLNYDASLNLRSTNFNQTPLHHAVINKSYNALKFILERSLINKDSKNKNEGETGKSSLVFFNIEDSQGKTPLDYAFIDMDKTAIKIIYDISSKKNRKFKPLFNIGDFHSAILELWENKDTELINLLIKRNNINKQDINGDTLLIKTARSNYIELAKLLLSKGADINLVNKLNQSVVHIAINYGNFELSNILLSNPKYNIVSSCDYKFSSKLHLAAETGAEDQLKHICIQKSIDINSKDNSGSTPLHYARNINTARNLLELGAKINEKDSNGRTALYNAIINNNSKLAIFLLDNGASANIYDKDNISIIHRLMSGFKIYINSFINVSFITSLLKSGANINDIHNNGRTMLHYTVPNLQIARNYHNLCDLTKLLLENKIIINAKDNNNQTAMDLIFIEENEKFLEYNIYLIGLFNYYNADCNKDLRKTTLERIYSKHQASIYQHQSLNLICNSILSKHVDASNITVSKDYIIHMKRNSPEIFGKLIVNGLDLRKHPEVYLEIINDPKIVLKNYQPKTSNTIISEAPLTIHMFTEKFKKCKEYYQNLLPVYRIFNSISKSDGKLVFHQFGFDQNIMNNIYLFILNSNPNNAHTSFINRLLLAEQIINTKIGKKISDIPLDSIVIPPHCKSILNYSLKIRPYNIIFDYILGADTKDFLKYFSKFFTNKTENLLLEKPDNNLRSAEVPIISSIEKLENIQGNEDKSTINTEDNNKRKLVPENCQIENESEHLDLTLKNKKQKTESQQCSIFKKDNNHENDVKWTDRIKDSDKDSNEELSSESFVSKISKRRRISNIEK